MARRRTTNSWAASTLFGILLLVTNAAQALPSTSKPPELVTNAAQALPSTSKPPEAAPLNAASSVPENKPSAPPTPAPEPAAASSVESTPDPHAVWVKHQKRSPVFADTLDRYNLFQRRLFNRQLFEQLSLPEQAFRIGNQWEAVAFAVDASVASTQVLAGEFSRFHGYFIFDTFTALRSPYGLDANLNLTLFNPSASDGIRGSSYAIPTGNLHFYHDFALEQLPSRIDVLGIDLGPTTLGNGLLIEQLPTEGLLANLNVGDYYLRHYFIGRGFWPDDDVFTLQAGTLDGYWDVMLLEWKFEHRQPAVAMYLDASARVPLVDHRVQLSAEYAVNLRQSPRHGLLLRSDYRDSAAGFEWHLGYQFRWYQQGFGPAQDWSEPSTHFNLPYREQEYVNNSFEYFAVSELFEQWSHGTMAEVELPLGCYFQAYLQGELIAGFARDVNPPLQLVRLPQGRDLPGTWLDGYYRAGLRLYPWRHLPHRLVTFVTNKQVESPFFPREETLIRFRPNGQWISLQIEAFL